MTELLQVGGVLNKHYIIESVLGVGGFGVTYLARDMTDGKQVAIKEYMPSYWAIRASNGKDVASNSSENQELFEHGRDVFQREVRMLSQFLGNEHVVQIYHSFEENNTSYFVMEYLDGVTLGTLAKSTDGKVPVQTAIEVLTVVSNTLAAVHDKGLLHRDISPENIFITKKGIVKLIDFGATRAYVGEQSQSMSVVIKPGFAPPEQYSQKGRLGPWTDVYALCATFYTIVIGKRPPDAPDRLAGEQIQDLRTYGVSAVISDAILKGMDLDFRKRYSNLRQFVTEIHKPYVPQPVKQQVQGNIPKPNEDRPHSKKYMEQCAHQKQVQAAPAQVRQQQVNRTIPHVVLMQGGIVKARWNLPTNTPIKIGRSSDKCHIVLNDKNLSRIHCALQYNDKQNKFYIQDLSKNGTFIANGRLNTGQSYVLSPGEQFYIISRDYTMEVRI
ncbi:MAG: FHA domain-containing serine/threonine-protein kinase [Eubacteriales bacterium]